MTGGRFNLNSPFKPSGDQPGAIAQLAAGLKAGRRHQTLLGVTGSGKTFTMANLITEVQKPTLVIAPNKTLAAQLTAEFRSFFPKSAVEYFVSYYDYYQPEAYVPGTDTYIEKETAINDEIDRLRHAATAALLDRQDVIIVASVSCIYGLGSPEEYRAQHFTLEVGGELKRDDVVARLVTLFYERSEVLERGRFRLRGQVLEIMPPDREVIARVEFSADRVRRLIEYDAVTRAELRHLTRYPVVPAKHFVVNEQTMRNALVAIETELGERLNYFEREGKLLEAERLERRTRHDLELLREIGTCPGIENYSRHLTGRAADQAPSTLIDFFPKDYLLFIDESHVTVSQIGGMYEGDRSRKLALVDYGFRLPSALDNRPLRFKEFEAKVHQAIYVSATPGKYELLKSRAAAQDTKDQRPNTHDGIVEQIVRPTGLVDPEIIVRPARHQVVDLLAYLPSVISDGGRVLVTTLTKKQAEQLADYLTDQNVKASFLHSEVATLERLEVLDQLRRGTIDVLIGVNLLREGLDLPEVMLVAILDADKEGFLRSEISLIQTMGRAARNVRGRVLLYADVVTGSMGRAIAEADRRRGVQVAYNKKHHITPKTIEKALASIIDHELRPLKPAKEYLQIFDPADLPQLIRAKEQAMRAAAKALKFEEAALLRDEVIQLKRLSQGRATS